MIHLPFLKADLAFTQLYFCPTLDLKIVWHLSFKFLALLWAIDFCWNAHLGSHREIRFSNSLTFTGVVWDVFVRFLGKLFQKEWGGGLSYVAKMLISGHLIEKDGSFGAQSATTGREGLSQLLIWDHESGTP